MLNIEKKLKKKRKKMTDTKILKFNHCAVFVEDDKIFKFGACFNITNEYKNIKMLPNMDSFYDTTKAKYVKLSKTETDNYLLLIKKGKFNTHMLLTFQNYFGESFKMKNNEMPFYKLEMPFIKGKTFETIFEDFQNSKTIKYCMEGIKMYEGHEGQVKQYEKLFIEQKKPCIDDKLWFDILKSFVFLYNDVSALNETYDMYHNDIHPGNLIYNFENNVIKLIDFHSLTLGESIDCLNTNSVFSRDLWMFYDIMLEFIGLNPNHKFVVEELQSYLVEETDVPDCDNLFSENLKNIIIKLREKFEI